MPNNVQITLDVPAEAVPMILNVLQGFTDALISASQPGDTEMDMPPKELTMSPDEQALQNELEGMQPLA